MITPTPLLSLPSVLGQSSRAVTMSDNFFHEFEQVHPDAAQWLREQCGGDVVYVPKHKSKAMMIRLIDSGELTTAEVAKLAGCSVRTVQQVRLETKRGRK